MTATSGASPISISVAPQTSLAEAVRILSRGFSAFSADHALEARILVCESAGINHVRLIADGARALGDETAALINARAARRIAREPLSRILGQRGFWSLTFDVSPAVLDPRPETETIVEAALELLRDRRAEPLRILDLGVGSGAILCALLSELPCASGVGVDISREACVVARANSVSLGFAERARIIEGDFARGFDGRFDLVVSNPPYIASDIIDTLEPEVRDHDPRIALDGGADGLSCYRALADLLPKILAPDGFGLLEIGFDQAAGVTALLATTGLRGAGQWKDAGGRDRALAVTVSETCKNA
jgi:release factor glutamine methyltransferase